jgi:hypothetical protein
MHLDCIQPNADKHCRSKRSDHYCAYHSQDHNIPRTPLAQQWVSYFALFDDFKNVCSKTISSTSDEKSETCFLTIGALACHKWNFPDNGGSDSNRNMSDFVNTFYLFKIC